jgi:hypothetical protein
MCVVVCLGFILSWTFGCAFKDLSHARMSPHLSSIHITQLQEKGEQHTLWAHSSLKRGGSNQGVTSVDRRPQVDQREDVLMSTPQSSRRNRIIKNSSARYAANPEKDDSQRQ